MQPFSSVNAVNYGDADNNGSLRRVPRELWSAIFVCCLPTHPSSDGELAVEIIRDPRLIPITLASVCQTWRYISCGTTELWATCWVNFVNPELNVIWLGRAGPRMLRLYGRCYKPCTKTFDWGPLTLSILPFQKQIKSLQMEVGTWGTISFIPEFDTPALQTLLLPQTCTMPIWMASLFPNSPQLREVELDMIRFDTTSLSITHVHNPCLSSLKVAAITTQDVILVLSTFPQLLHLSFLLYEDENTHRLDIPDITHRGLVSLRMNGGSLPYLLDKLTLPSLRTFHNMNAFDPDGFFSFINRSQCHITELNIGNHRIPDEDLITTLRDDSISHWVERLELPGSTFCVTPELLNLLHYSPNNQSFPNLTELLFDECAFEYVPDGVLADTIISRCGPLGLTYQDCSGPVLQPEVRLRYVSINWLDRAAHSLDIARLVPLPEFWQVDLKNAMIVIDFVPTDEIPDEVSGGFQNPLPKKVWLGKSSSRRRHPHDDL